MATAMEVPVSPMSAHAYPTAMHDAATIDISHLSGATMADFLRNPKMTLVNAGQVSSKRASIVSKASSSRHSVASTTKSTLRHSNQLLIEMLQNIQVELSAHRSIMLDIQHRVSHLEHESVASVNNDPPQLGTLQALEGRPTKRNSRAIPPEGQAWWQACQNFAKNSDPPLSAGVFLRTPSRFSGLDWQYNAPPSAKLQTPPATPPAVDELPPLTPTSEACENTDLDTPTKLDLEFDADEFIASTPKPLVVDDIREHTIEIGEKRLPAPPVLLPPPAGKPVSIKSQEIITEVAPVANAERFYKGVRSLVSYKALMKHKATDKEHHVLIHFHRRADLKDLEEAT